MTSERNSGERAGVEWHLEGDYLAIRLPVKTEIYPDGITMKVKGSYTPVDKVTVDGVTTMPGGETSAETIRKGIEPDFSNIEKAAESLNQAVEAVQQAKKVVEGLITIMRALRPLKYQGTVNVDDALLGKMVIRGNLVSTDEFWRKTFALEGIHIESGGTRTKYVMALDGDGRYFYDPDRGVKYLKVSEGRIEREEVPTQK